MATRSSILAWKIPWTEQPVRLHPMGLQRIGHHLATKQQHFLLNFEVSSSLEQLTLLIIMLAVAPHSSTLAWRIPWTEEPGGLQSMGSLRVGHD